MRLEFGLYQIKGSSRFSYIAVSFHPEVTIGLRLYHTQGSSHFSYTAISFHPKVTIGLRLLPHTQGSSHFSYTAVSFHHEVRLWLRHYQIRGSNRFSYIAVSSHPEVKIGLRPRQTQGSSFQFSLHFGRKTLKLITKFWLRHSTYIHYQIKKHIFDFQGVSFFTRSH